MPLSPDPKHVFTVSQLNREVRMILEQQFGFIWLEAEISNLSRPASGHWYLSLKDENSQIRCAMFKGKNRLLKFKPQNGDQVLVRGALGLYEARGDFQLIIDRMEPIGTGALQRRFEETKLKLFNEGLFEESIKQNLPVYPRTIGVITSTTGAAIRDVLHVLERRFPTIPVIIYPTMVQGDAAAGQICAAIDTANTRKECETLLLVRGGGSLEDLWSFNEESVARAIHRSLIPIVSGVGHETDFTIADLVADVRAPTPSAAAEISTPDIREERALLQSLSDHLHLRMQNQLDNAKAQLALLERRLLTQHPQRQLQQKVQLTDELEKRLNNAMSRKIENLNLRSNNLNRHLANLTPRVTISRFTDRVEQLQQRAMSVTTTRLEKERDKLNAIMRALDNVSPLATLDRGYAVMKSPDGKMLNSISSVKAGDEITATLKDGNLHCRVDTVSENKIFTKT